MTLFCGLSIWHGYVVGTYTMIIFWWKISLWFDYSKRHEGLPFPSINESFRIVTLPLMWIFPLLILMSWSELFGLEVLYENLYNGLLFIYKWCLFFNKWIKFTFACLERLSGIRPAACKTFTLVTVVRLKIKASLVVLAFLQTFRLISPNFVW